jgi:hypothetical protein
MYQVLLQWLYANPRTTTVWQLAGSESTLDPTAVLPATATAGVLPPVEDGHAW